MPSGPPAADSTHPRPRTLTLTLWTTGLPACRCAQRPQSATPTRWSFHVNAVASLSRSHTGKDDPAVPRRPMMIRRQASPDRTAEVVRALEQVTRPVTQPSEAGASAVIGRAAYP